MIDRQDKACLTKRLDHGGFSERAAEQTSHKQYAMTRRRYARVSEAGSIGSNYQMRHRHQALFLSVRDWLPLNVKRRTQRYFGVVVISLIKSQAGDN